MKSTSKKKSKSIKKQTSIKKTTTQKKSAPPKKAASKKPKIALYWCASCGGCEETVVDLDEKILDVVAAVDIVFWPCAMDFKYADVEQMAAGSIDVAFINGAVRNSEQKHIATMLREKSKLVVAFGDCAWLGGIPALANLKNAKSIIDRAYIEMETVQNPEKITPQEKSNVDGFDLTLPTFYETVHKLDDLITVDYYLPGCPPAAQSVANAVGAILSGKLPAKGTVLGSEKSLCASCDRNASKPDNMTAEQSRRIFEIQADPKLCFIAQGVVCMGPATRDGCEYPCVKGNMPCTGCYGPLPNTDQGARMTAALGGVFSGDSEKSAEASLSGIVDPAGTFYRYSMASSLLGSQRKEHD
jgi:F420-non-reducing hydrogenase small subunit